ncbi:MAG: Glu-tRNA(Gln) amidotransferase subunit GatE, partial [Candidatus Micrarchaeia archaeon]
GMNGKLRYEINEENIKENNKDTDIQEKSEKEIGIQTIAIEEESCGIIGEQKGEIESFRLDRLGIPLVEIATTPDIKSGKEARMVAERIGLMLRSTGKMMRGIGTIRQDLNISIPGGARVEIKGVQELELIETVIENEIKRQSKLIEICEKIKSILSKYKEVNHIIEGDPEKVDEKIEKEIKDVTHLFTNTGSKMIKKAIENGKSVFAIKLPGMKGIFGIELYPDYRYGSELSDYAKTQGLGGIIHSDENIDKYNIRNEIGEIANVLKLNHDDGWIIVVGEKEQCISALKLVFKRAYATNVPEETRRADLQGRTHYMRPLPGSARMYPETDIAPIRITEEMIAESQNFAPFQEIEERVRSLLNADMAGKIIRSEKLNLFLELVEEGVNPTVAAVTCEDTIKSLRREGVDVNSLSEEKIKKILILYRDGKITKAAIPEVLKLVAEKKQVIAENMEEIEGIISSARLMRISGEKLKEIIEKEEIKSAKEIQRLMAKYRLNIDPQEAMEIINKQ